MVLYSDVRHFESNALYGVRHVKDGRGRASDGSHRARLREDVMMDQRLMSSVAVSEDGRARTRNAQRWNCCCSSKPTNDR